MESSPHLTAKMGTL